MLIARLAVACAGCAMTFSAAMAARPDVAASSDLVPIHQIGHLYINLKTGERSATLYNDRAGPDVWNNDDSAVCGNFFYAVDRPTRPTTDPRPRFGASVNTIGDIRGVSNVGRRIDGLGFGTATKDIKSTNTTRHECAGLDFVVLIYENDDANGDTPDTRAHVVASQTIKNIAAEEGTGNGWSFTVDLAGGNEFIIGDQDLDGNGNFDFGWGMAFVQGQSLTDGINSAKGMCGPYLVAPGGFVNELGVASTSTSSGVPNRLHWYSPLTFDATGKPQDRSHQSFVGSYSFGTPTSTNPFASTYLILQGPCRDCVTDINGDCFVDFTDFDYFVDAFERGAGSSDWNQDGYLDYTDFDELFGVLRRAAEKCRRLLRCDSMCKLSLILTIVGTATVAVARPDVAASPDLFPIHRAGHLYINLKTGERAATLYDDRVRSNPWRNDDAGVCGSFFYGVDRPTRPSTDPRPRFGGSVHAIGDVRAPAETGAYVYGLEFATGSIGIRSTDAINHSCAGLDLVVFIYNNDDGNGGTPDPRAQVIFSTTIHDIPAEEGTSNAWSYSIDLSGGNEFWLGDQDLDGDLNLDFGWSFAMVQGQSLTDGINSAKGVCGPFLAAPAGFVNELGEASASTSLGVPNRLHWYSPLTFDSSGRPQDRSHQSFIGSYDFGVPTSTNPYAATYLAMMTPCVGCPMDFNQDCYVDFLDFDAFVLAFESGDPSSDFNQDGFIDYTDFDEFVAGFEAGC